MTAYLPISSNLVLAYSAYLVATASPGPSNLAIMAMAMNSGRKAALLFALGVVSGSFFWALLAAFGLAAVLASYAQALSVIKLLGGLYLLWLAAKSAKSALIATPPIPLGSKRIVEPALLVYARGLGLHITNPKAILAWVAIVSLALPSGAPTSAALSVVVGCLCLGIVVFGGYALAFSTTTARRIYGAARRWLEGALALVFGFAGIKLLLSRS
jgi:threonine/homoserine/homoserine lactone efflux protein